MRRKKGQLVPLEISILEAGLNLRSRGAPEFHGFFIAKEVAQREGAMKLTAYGTLYKALARLQDRGLLESHWEDPLVGQEQSRPRRRLYHVTADGAQALVSARIGEASARPVPVKGVVTP